MHDNTHIQMVATDSCGSREREHSNSGTFVRLNALDYKRAEQGEVFELALSQGKLRVRSS